MPGEGGRDREDSVLGVQVRHRRREGEPDRVGDTPPVQLGQELFGAATIGAPTRRWFLRVSQPRLRATRSPAAGRRRPSASLMTCNPAQLSGRTPSASMRSGGVAGRWGGGVVGLRKVRCSSSARPRPASRVRGCGRGLWRRGSARSPGRTRVPADGVANAAVDRQAEPGPREPRPAPKGRSRGPRAYGPPPPMFIFTRTHTSGTGTGRPVTGATAGAPATGRPALGRGARTATASMRLRGVSPECPGQASSAESRGQGGVRRGKEYEDHLRDALGAADASEKGNASEFVWPGKLCTAGDPEEAG